MQLVCKRRHTAFVVANGGRELLRKGDDLRYANALPELFVEGGQQPNHGGSLHIGKGILNPFLREDMLHTPVVISSVGTGKRQCILRKLYHMQNTALGRTKQLGSQIVLFDCRDDLLQGNTCLCQLFPQRIRDVQSFTANGAAGYGFALVGHAVLPVVQRQQIVVNDWCSHALPPVTFF